MADQAQYDLAIIRPAVLVVVQVSKEHITSMINISSKDIFRSEYRHLKYLTILRKPRGKITPICR